MVETIAFPYNKVKQLIENAESITILSHLNPDADTIGTALGIYRLLKEQKIRNVEVVNASAVLPRSIDFLSGYEKIKRKIEYEESLVISCDAPSISRLGFDLSGREILNIDHHQSNEFYGSLNVVMPEYASASQVAFELFRKCYPISKESAECWYAALLSDTRYFTTSAVNASVFMVAESLIDLGVDPAKTAAYFTQRRSLSSFRILQRALESLRLYDNAQIAVLSVSKEDIMATGATVPDMEGIVDYGRSLVTVKVALFVMELEEEIRVSLRSKGVDVDAIASCFGGGGHHVAAGITFKEGNLQEIIDTIIVKIQETGLADGKKT